MRVTEADRGIRRAVYTLGLAASVLILCGSVFNAVWVLGIGGWLMAAAFVVELVYRPGRLPGDR
ncbi:hypothetical protein [Streptomyces sp. NPDC003023]|uniref:hypothetical protein n=1 Tax=Streptomyces sp. NPDC003023 TaxID=3364675 RepID=UPI0036CA9DF7